MKKISALTVLLSIMTLAAAQSADEPRQPVVNWGLKTQANVSNFRIKNIATLPNLKSRMRFGGEFGGFVDFNISQHFYMQFNLLGTYEECSLDFGDRVAPMRSVSMEIPIFALWRRSLSGGHLLSVGGGPYTEFVLFGDLEGSNPYRHVITNDATGEESIVTGDSHSGLALFAGFELACGLQFNATYHFGISDLLLYEHDSRDTFMRNQKLTVGLGFRF